MKIFISLCVLFAFQLLQVESLSGTCNSFEREKLNEGYKPCVYTDTLGHPTVGIGFNLDRADARRKLSAVGADYDQVRAGRACLSSYQIQKLFTDDMANAVSCASSWLSSIWWQMSSDKQSAVADMVFNMGCSRLRKFRNMKAALEKQDYRKAAVEMRNSRWCTQVKSRCNRNISCMNGALATLMRMLGLKYF